MKVSLIDDGTALVSWTPPDQPDLTVAHYTIMYASQTSWLAGEWQVLQKEGEPTEAQTKHLYLSERY